PSKSAAQNKISIYCSKLRKLLKILCVKIAKIQSYFQLLGEKMIEIPSPIILLVMIIIERFIFRNTVDK
ncbi:hypothetical protein, partial [Glaesserella parasuis]|uniref:hypothetical protein n=1 Tax=Glaesserella parasuis TaxID=738 RepID=UPI001BE4A1C4